MARSKKQTLDYLIDLYDPILRDAFLASIQGIVDDALLDEVIKAIENGDPIGAFQALGFTPAAMRPLTAAIESAFERGGVLTGDNFPKYLQTPSGRAVFRFDVRNSRAEAWLRDHSSQLVTRLTDEARRNVQTVLQRGMIAGENPRNVARDLVGHYDPATKQRVGGVVGLTNNQERWVANTRRDLNDINDIIRNNKNLPPAELRKLIEASPYFNRELRDKRFDSTIFAAAKLARTLPPESVDKLVTAYSSKALKYRGDSIARTEAMQALNRSEYEAHLQAVDIGALRRQDITRHWDSAGDSRVRWSHKSMDAKYAATGVGIDEPFVSPSGARMMFPGDTSLGAPADEVVMCRCRVKLDVDFLAQWNDDAPPVKLPSKPLETAAERNLRLDREMKAYTLENGKRDGIEHLRVYNSLTGEEIKTNAKKRTSNSITFDDDLIRLLNDGNNNLILHHNHPGSNSFSKADLNILNRPGAGGIWAHGHDGSSYYAERGTRQFKTGDYERIEAQAKLHVQSAVNNRLMTPEDANRVFYHIVSTKLSEAQMIKYIASLIPETETAMQRNEAVIRKILENLK